MNSELVSDLDTAALDKLRAEGTPRGRAPSGWPAFNWPEKRDVLFGFYGPSEQEKQFIVEAVPQSPIVKPEHKRKLLVFYRCQYPHASIATANFAYQQLAKATDAFDIMLTDDPALIRTSNLSQYDALLLNNTTDFDVTVGADGRAAILNFVRSGKGLIGIHAAADSCKGWRDGARLINGIFSCHPWLPTGTWAFQLQSPEHPINQAIEGKGFWLRDEVYAYRDGSHSPDQSRELVSLDLTKSENHDSPSLRESLRDRTNAKPHRPVAWIHRFGEGRVFYSNLGHNNTTYWHPMVLTHYLAGIQYALGDLHADDTATTELAIVNTSPAPIDH
ncbi:ThuA domain-containing protein [Novipirellula herctigrandis]|uniref:ThuA domain-containing protein n=1 Tax=Novipirellula herctigrandis TaxID=2527986 RepID=UPI003AF3F923